MRKTLIAGGIAAAFVSFAVWASVNVGNGAPAPGVMDLVGGSDGTNARTLSTDSSGNVEVVGPVADGAAPGTAKPLFEGYGFNGVAYAPRYCDKSIAFTTQGTTSIVKQIAEVANQHIYVCGWILSASTATAGTSLTFYSGSGANCGTGSNAAIGGPIIGTTPTAAPATPNSIYGPGNPALRFTLAAGDALCTKQGATTNATTLSGTIFYTQN